MKGLSVLFNVKRFSDTFETLLCIIFTLLSRLSQRSRILDFIDLSSPTENLTAEGLTNHNEDEVIDLDSDTSAGEDDRVSGNRIDNDDLSPVEFLQNPTSDDAEYSTNEGGEYL